MADCCSCQGALHTFHAIHLALFMSFIAHLSDIKHGTVLRLQLVKPFYNALINKAV